MAVDAREKLAAALDEAEEWADNKCDELECVTCPADKMKGNCIQQLIVDRLIAHGVTVQDVTDISVGSKWISVKERLPQNFVSVLGYMTDAGEFPPVRECYTVGNAFFFPALGDVHPVSHWCEMPQPPKGDDYGLPTMLRM